VNLKRLSVNTPAVCPTSDQIVMTTKAIELRPATEDLAKKVLWWNCPICHRWHKLKAPTETRSAISRCLARIDNIEKQ
jgi:hypothetical protein